MSNLIRLQYMIRGFLARSAYKRHRTDYESKKSQYFTREEGAETLDNTKPFDLNQKHVFRKHTYKSGAHYEGQWKGGMRHGAGTMTWPDGTKYEGTWDYNAAHGLGILIQKDGAEYDGRFKNNMCFGKGKYKNAHGGVYKG